MLQYTDQLKMHLIAGAGGQGALSFCRSRTRPRGGPDGGHGGPGGQIGFFSDSRYKDFSHLKKKTFFKAKKGGKGEGALKSGPKGDDLLIPVPQGTLIRDIKGRFLKDLFQEENPFWFLKGGQGGKGNSFYKNSKNQAPIQFQKGRPGEQAQVVLELKPLVEIALLGRTNTGKSTLFNKITGGKSPIGDYHCTTLNPYYGQIKAFSLPCFLMDIPGIPEESKQETGVPFLRLTGRAKLLLIFLNANENPIETLIQLNSELKAFDKNHNVDKTFALERKNKIFILSKSDQVEKSKIKILLAETGAALKATQKGKGAAKQSSIKEPPLLALSSKTGEGLSDLLSAIQKALSYTHHV